MRRRLKLDAQTASMPSHAAEERVEQALAQESPASAQRLGIPDPGGFRDGVWRGKLRSVPSLRSARLSTRREENMEHRLSWREVHESGAGHQSLYMFRQSVSV